MSRRQRWHRYGRSTDIVIHNARVIIPRDEMDEPPRRTLSLGDFILGIMAGMVFLRLLEIGHTIVLR